MILAVDVDYRESEAYVAGIAFADWADAKPEELFISRVADVADYEPGKFYKRELPCILTLLREHSLKPDCIVVDGYVYLDGHEQPGLGKYLYDAINGECPVVGVAKERFKGIAEDYAIYRASSKRTLFVTAVGINVEKARHAITSMHGEFRIPNLLKLADQTCRSQESQID